MTRIRFFGVAAYEIVTGTGQHILLDPFLDENPGSPAVSRGHPLVASERQGSADLGRRQFENGAAGVCGV